MCPSVKTNRPTGLIHNHAPRNIFTRWGAARTVLKSINKSPAKAIEMVQDNRNNAIHNLANEKNRFH